MPSRRELIALSPEEIQEFLEAQKTLIIVSNGRDGYPHPMPMWYYTDADGCLYCTTFKKAQKVFNWQRDAKASLLVESGEEYAELKSVLIYATAEIIDDIDEVCEALVNIGSKGRTLSADERQAMKGGMTKTAEKRVLLRFTPQRYVSWDHAKLGGKY
ncbi:MAG: pyridoxamine 5'-phosphate oxidase [Gammaproteobacteria bacterium]|nr:pyridoxamine 5'-phosphate oxidase [Gammaproteobacteria bacterium]|tara:strand:- start:38 stop:511 length:474 start_codon:yes stop_codon:yes gene_type:complete